MIRKMRYGDIGSVVDLYDEYMFDSFFASMGRSFLLLIFEAIFNSNNSLAYVYEKDASVKGFIVAATNTRKLFREILKKKFFALMVSALHSLMKEPSLLFKFFESFFYSKKTKIKDVDAEFLFITIHPEHRDLKISKAMIQAILMEYKGSLIKRAKVSTQKDNVIANNLLKSLGFHTIRSFVLYGKDSLLHEVAIENHK